jgi:hypothetical protein
MARVNATPRRGREVAEQHTYFLALFDVLGFENRFQQLGLTEMARRYETLIDGVDQQNRRFAEVFGVFDFKESAYWSAEGEIAILHRLWGAYASDSILVWAHSAWPEARGKTPDELEELAKNPTEGWCYETIPCELFLRGCSELICRSIEVGLPLRGALAMGTAILDEARGVYLGAPLIEAARLERDQTIIGASLCESFMRQTIPRRFQLPVDTHLKPNHSGTFGGAILDWPRHWRRTRTDDARRHVVDLSEDAGSKKLYYENTLQLLDLSHQQRGAFESPEDVLIRSLYPAFGVPGLKASMRPSRKP